MKERIVWRDERRRGPNRTDPEGWYFGDFFVGDSDKAVDKELGTGVWFSGMEVEMASGVWRLVGVEEPDDYDDDDDGEPSPYATLPPDGDFTLWYKDPATSSLSVQRRFKGEHAEQYAVEYINKIPPVAQRHWWVRMPQGNWCGVELFYVG